MSYPTTIIMESRSSTDVPHGNKPFKSWSLLTWDTEPVPLMDPVHCPKDLDTGVSFPISNYQNKSANKYSITLLYATPADPSGLKSPIPSFGNAIEKAEARRKKEEEAKRRGPVYEPDDQHPPPSDPTEVYSKIVPVEKLSPEKWRQSLKRRKLDHPSGSNSQTNDPCLREYQSEPAMPVADMEPWMWRPAGLSRWPKWALKRRAEAVAKLSSEREKSPFWTRKRKWVDEDDG
ncbi:uncharacterized protein STEHIDRAFT_110946 [Stereum hirsutum FP-91666 SS1]|uniref:uncharacterized protein n=1 Tax=Stereum hirsutum (strain FP-91666) TaxID=721885 RepID=UPI000440B550|nr:uncharacterized protein STEHIDRAFT_110946 [Stereum hirsutum FP-91666 SS1]EIM86433.1 hypothetical protein STEHIDRAFT_110946 [Stereum hirsutum FP-91666 SS1]